MLEDYEKRRLFTQESKNNHTDQEIHTGDTAGKQDSVRKASYRTERISKMRADTNII